MFFLPRLSYFRPLKKATKKNSLLFDDFGFEHCRIRSPVIRTHVVAQKGAKKAKPQTGRQKETGEQDILFHTLLASLSLLGLREWRFLSLPFPVCVCVFVCVVVVLRAMLLRPLPAAGRRGEVERKPPLGSPFSLPLLPLSDRSVTRAHRKENVGASAVRPPARPSVTFPPELSSVSRGPVLLASGRIGLGTYLPKL